MQTDSLTSLGHLLPAHPALGAKQGVPRVPSPACDGSRAPARPVSPAELRVPVLQRLVHEDIAGAEGKVWAVWRRDDSVWQSQMGREGEGVLALSFPVDGSFLGPAWEELVLVPREPGMVSGCAMRRAQSCCKETQPRP